MGLGMALAGAARAGRRTAPSGRQVRQDTDPIHPPVYG
jgi:hypothetical protein